jgi:glutamate-1-semialdehyde 2,1-aminomutase
MALGTRSELFARARRLIPGGVNSPVRAWRAVGDDDPFFVARGEGAYLEDVDGKRYVDWVMSWGALLFGHADPETVEAITDAARDGTSFGAPTEREVELAEEIADAFPSIELVRLVSSGTEAAMSAIRVARGFTKRDRILKFEGGYHGHADALLANAGSGLATLGIPASAGVTTGAAKDTIVAPYNDVDAAAAAVERYGEGLAAIIVEPVSGNMGVVPPREGFLEALRKLADASGALLIFDEVITGFRVARGGAQERFGVKPDLTILGKIVGGGLPLAAFGGRADAMERLAPMGDVYQAGTLSGNPLATAAGLSVLRRLRDPSVYDELEERGAKLERGLRPYGAVQRVGAMLTLFRPGFDELFRGLVERGVYVAPSQYEAMFVSLAHGDEEIERTAEAVRGALGDDRS